MTILDTTILSPKLEAYSPSASPLTLSPINSSPVRRASSCGTLDNRSKRPSLPDLIAASNKLASKRTVNASKAAVRAAVSNLRETSSRSPTTEHGALRSPLEPGSNSSVPQPNPNRISPSDRSSHSITPPLASGPAAGLQQQPGTYESVEQINNRFNRQPASLPIYLIRTDLRYIPTLDMVTVYMELPGLRLEDVSLKIGNRSNGIRHLVVTAISRPPTHARNEMAMQERVFGCFSRTLIVPPHVQASDIKAEMSNGLLTLQIPGTKFESIKIHARRN